MGRNKAVGPDQIHIEAWRGLGDEGVKWLTCLFNKIFSSAKMPDEWRLSEVIPVYKNKGDAQACSNYRESAERLNNKLESWRKTLEDNGLWVSREKTEYLRCDFGRSGRIVDDVAHRIRADMISNEVFRAALDVDSIIDKMREGRLRWFGHVKRRPQSAPVKRVEAMVSDFLSSF
uniref:Uncharacterized protein n=1 Tax=Tanacetum cinerariifolium TaxID=118510 RepID=A0A6L2LPA4_TANCI|nr:hypothetical protein [Tanacetum cinerariifolium]